MPSVLWFKSGAPCLPRWKSWVGSVKSGCVVGWETKVGVQGGGSASFYVSVVHPSWSAGLGHLAWCEGVQPERASPLPPPIPCAGVLLPNTPIPLPGGCCSRAPLCSCCASALGPDAGPAGASPLRDLGVPPSLNLTFSVDWGHCLSDLSAPVFILLPFVTFDHEVKVPVSCRLSSQPARTRPRAAPSRLPLEQQQPQV